MKDEDANQSFGKSCETEYDSNNVSAEEALRPDKGTEKEFIVENNPFGVTPGELNKMQNPKSLAAFIALGGLRGIERALRTNVSAGLSVDETRLDGTVSRATEIAVMANMPSVDRHCAPSFAANDVAPKHTDQDQHVDRRRIFKDNRLPPRRTYTLC